MKSLRYLGVILAILLVAAACGGTGTPAPQPTTAAPTATPEPLPSVEAGTYMHTIQTNGKIRIGTQEDNPPFSVKNPATQALSLIHI